MKSGFTLMELLIVIGIMVILVSGVCKCVGIHNPFFGDNDTKPERTYIYDSNGHVIIHEN